MYHKWANLQNAQALYSRGDEIWGILGCFSTIVLLVVSAGQPQSHDPHFQHSLTDSHKLMGNLKRTWSSLATFLLEKILLVGAFREKVNGKMVHPLHLHCTNYSWTLSSYLPASWEGKEARFPRKLNGEANWKSEDTSAPIDFFCPPWLFCLCLGKEIFLKIRKEILMKQWSSGSQVV